MTIAAVVGWVRAIVLLPLGGTAVPAAGQVSYTVTVDPVRPLEAVVTMALPAVHQPRKLVTRGLHWGLQSQISDPRSGAVPLKLLRKGEWLLPPQTRRVRWKVSFAHPAPGAFDASNQLSVFFSERRWWLFSEPTSLLRVAGDSRPALVTIRSASGPLLQAGATPNGKGAWRVPSAKGAPEFYAFGNIAVRERSVGNIKLRYVADDPELVAMLGLAAHHEAALGYLSKVLPPPRGIPATERSLLVVWMGIDRTHGRAGGAPGTRSFLANYVYGSGEKSPFDTAITTMVVAHEQLHQLVELASGTKRSFPTWLYESLAHYYGLKALGKSGLPPKAIEELRRRFIDPHRPVDEGLVALNRRTRREIRLFTDGSTRRERRSGRR